MWSIEALNRLNSEREQKERTEVAEGEPEFEQPAEPHSKDVKAALNLLGRKGITDIGLQRDYIAEKFNVKLGVALRLVVENL